MPLTREFRETIQPRMERVSAFGEELLGQGAQSLLSDDMDTSHPPARLTHKSSEVLAFDYISPSGATFLSSPDDRTAAAVHDSQSASLISVSSNSSSSGRFGCPSHNANSLFRGVSL